MREHPYYELSRFSRELASLLKLGYPVQEAVALQEKHTNFALGSAIDQLRKGASLTESLQSCSFFSPLYLRMLSAAEHNETLPEGLEKAAEALENLAQRKFRITLGVTYPAILVSCASLFIYFVCSVIGTFLENLFRSYELSLPPSTEFFFLLSKLSLEPLGLLLFCLPSALLWYLCLGQFPLVRWRYRVPIYGTWLLREEAAAYLHALSRLVSVGTPLVGATQAAAGVVSASLQPILLQVPGALEEGDTLWEALSRHRFLPDMALSVLKRTETSGELKLDKLAKLIDRELEVALGTGVLIFEPLTLLALGGFLGFTVTSIFQPLYQLLGNLG